MGEAETQETNFWRLRLGYKGKEIWREKGIEFEEGQRVILKREFWDFFLVFGKGRLRRLEGNLLRSLRVKKRGSL